MYYWKNDHLILNIYVQPNAKKNEVVGCYDDALKIRIQSPAVDGKANEALIKFLAGLFDVSKTEVIILRGQQSRKKQVSVCSLKNLKGIINEENSFSK